MAVFESAVYLDLKDLREQITFFPHYPYQLQNQSYAEDLVKESVGRIREVNLFGNGFPLPKVPSPQTVIYSSFTLFYSGLGSGRKGMKGESGSLRSDDEKDEEEDALWEEEELDYL